MASCTVTLMATNKLIKPGDPADVYRDRMRAAFPKAGTDVYKFMTVYMGPGEAISVHKHAYDLVMFYPEKAEPITLTPEPGTMLYMPAGTAHAVGAVKKQRLSIAMLIEVQK